jgi:hypothetical protein
MEQYVLSIKPGPNSNFFVTLSLFKNTFHIHFSCLGKFWQKPDQYQLSISCKKTCTELVQHSVRGGGGGARFDEMSPPALKVVWFGNTAQLSSGEEGNTF